MNVTEFLESIMPTRDQIDNFLHAGPGPAGWHPNNGWRYDPELGWVTAPTFKRDGADKSIARYSYEEDGARRCLQYADQPCRIHAYGNSFTHCDQVSDGETWEEYLAAHLQEPIRNYGVGGYSVYQAYLRMRKVEARLPAEYIILNIYDDDHFRNLDRWRTIRFGRRGPCGFTLPHLRVDLDKESCEAFANPLPRSEDLYKLLDRDWVIETFHDDAMLRLYFDAQGGQDIQFVIKDPVAVSFGIPLDEASKGDDAVRIRRMTTEMALFASRNVVEWTEEFAEESGKKLLVMLSFGRRNLRRALDGEERFDRTFVDWLGSRGFPVVDMLEVFTEEFRRSKLPPDDFIAQYYIGHHNPPGNHFTAWAMKNTMVNWLEPKPPAYRE